VCFTMHSVTAYAYCTQYGRLCGNFHACFITEMQSSILRAIELNVKIKKVRVLKF